MTVMKNVRYFFAAFFFVALSATLNFAQVENKKPTEENKIADPYPESVRLSAIVLDKKEQPVTNLGVHDFRVFANNEKQEIYRFTNESQPLLAGIVLDASGSLRTQFNSIAFAHKVIVNNLAENDEAFLTKFIGSDKIIELQDFTSRKQALLSGFDDYYVEGGKTAFFDAIYKTADKLAKYKEDENQFHRVLIFITDGDERGSTHTEEEVFKLLRETNIQFFAIGLIQSLEADGGFFKKSNREKATVLLDKLAAETGGMAFYPQKGTDIPRLVQDLVQTLRSQYFISFTPNNQKKNQLYKVRIEVAESKERGKLKVISRSGYTLK
jgi:VWFA-related protein